MISDVTAESPGVAHSYVGSETIERAVSPNPADVPTPPTEESSSAVPSSEAEVSTSWAAVAEELQVGDPLKDSRVRRAKQAERVGRLVDKLERYKATRHIMRLIPAEFTVASGNIGKGVVTVIEARDLPDLKTMFRRSGAVNPFCVVHTGMHWWRTATCVKTSDPVWNTKFEFEMEDLSHEIRFLIFDGREELIGQAVVALGALAPRMNQDTSVWLPLRVRADINASDATSLATLQGYLHVRFRWYCEDLTAALLNHIAALESETGASALYIGNREQTMRKLERAGIPSRVYDLVYQNGKKIKVDGALVRNNLFVLQEAIFGPAYALLMYISKVRSWRDPVTTLVWLVFYVTFCCVPGLIVRWSPLFLAIFIIQRRRRQSFASDDEAPERLPHALKRVGVNENGTAITDEDWETLSNGTTSSSRRLAAPSSPSQVDGKAAEGASKDQSKDPGWLGRIKQVKSGMTAMDSAMTSYYDVYTRVVNVCNWSSPTGTGLFCGVLIALWLVLLVVPVRIVFLGFGMAFFLVPPSERDRSSVLTRFLYRIPPARRTLRYEDRRPSAGEQGW